MGKFKSGDKVKWVDASEPRVSKGTVFNSHSGEQWVVDTTTIDMSRISNDSCWELDTASEVKPDFKPGDRVVRCMFPLSKPSLGNGTVVCGSIKGTYVVIDDEGNSNSLLDQWVPADKARGILEGLNK